MMKKIFTILLLFGIFCWQPLFAQTTFTGKVVDETGQGMAGVNIVLENARTTGVATDSDGSFSLTIPKAEGKITLLFSFIGYETFSKTVDAENPNIGAIKMQPTSLMSQEVVVSGSRVAEKLTESPATIDVINSKQIQDYASANPGELLSRVKGVDYIRSGVAGTGINVRGFNSNFNSKNLQVSDGRISTLIATGLPFGPLNTQIKEDIDRVEVILGPNAVLFGPNAHNGLVNTITKDPRTSQGTTVALNVGNQSQLSVRARQATKINDKWAFKVTGEYSKAKEFKYMDSVYIDLQDAQGNYFYEPGFQGYDGVKEGHNELELDRDIEFLKGEAALYYSIANDKDIIINYGVSNSTYLAPTNVGRNQIKDWGIQYLQARYTSPHFFAQIYETWSKTDSTYSIDERTKQYWRLRQAGYSDAQARGPMSYASGALFIDDSRRTNAEIQYNNKFGGLELVAGAQYQLDEANSHGTYLLDNYDFDHIRIAQYGLYAQLQYEFGDSGFKAIAAARADNHEVYGFNFVPKVGITKTGEHGTWRLTYGKGIAAPTILNMYGNLFSGLILGNADGFTLADGTKIEKQRVEKLQTFELGYKGVLLNKKLYIDANAYDNISKDFLSPVMVIGVASKRGDTPIQQVQSGYGIYGGLVATYLNFGKFNTYGFDIGLTYQLAKNWSVNGNYSYFGYSIDKNNLKNDFNNDGEVNKLDLLINAPHNKAGLGLNFDNKKLYGTIFGRWVEAYDYFSSYQIAAKTQDLVYRGTPVVANARSTDSWNYGPLGGFVNVDLNMGYHINDMFTVSGQVTNLFDSKVREFTASPFIGRLYSLELKFHLDQNKK